MGRVNSGYLMNGVSELWYEVKDDGFDIYLGETAEYPSFTQPEPYIPYPNLSYEENAKKMCEELSEEYPQETGKTLSERLTDVEANIDYLMLLNDPDSAAE